MFTVADRVQETTNSLGTGTATLLGAVSGYQSFSTGIGANNTTFYVIADQLGTNWEVGLGALNATGTVLTRTTVYSSSNGGSTVNFATGTQYVWCDFPSSKAVIQGTAVNFYSIGATTAGTGAFTALSASTVSGAGFSNYFAAPPTIGNTTPNAGTFTDLAYTGTLTGGTGVVNLGSGQFYKDASGNVGIGTSSPLAQLGVFGVGQTTAAMSTATGLGGTLYVRDSGGLSGNGGAVLFGASQGSFAAIKGFITNGTNNTVGELVFSNRNASTDTTLTERMRIDTGGNVLVGITSANANGGVLQLKSGITFPATQVLATDANTLDDYEEGTWTPNVENTSSSSTWSTKIGRYTKIGRFVYCSFLCDAGNSGTLGGALVVSGLPFTYGGTNNVPTLTGFTANGLATENYLVSRTQNGSTSFSITTTTGALLTVSLTFAAGTIVYEV